MTRRLFLAPLLLPPLLAQRPPQPSNLVPDADTAIELAKVLLGRLYGKKFVRRKVYTASEDDDVWCVIGKPNVPAGVRPTGGVVELRIMRENARVTYLFLDLRATKLSGSREDVGHAM